jgi:hypothetical protein
MPRRLPSTRSSTCTVVCRGLKPAGSGRLPRRLWKLPSDMAIGCSVTVSSGRFDSPATTNCTTPVSGLAPALSRDSTTS